MNEFTRNFGWKLSETPGQRVFGSQSSGTRRTGDPSMVSLTIGEVRRLVDIETSALLALEAMSSIPSTDKDLFDAAQALANALASPAHGG